MSFEEQINLTILSNYCKLLRVNIAICHLAAHLKGQIVSYVCQNGSKSLFFLEEAPDAKHSELTSESALLCRPLPGRARAALSFSQRDVPTLRSEAQSVPSIKRRSWRGQHSRPHISHQSRELSRRCQQPHCTLHT